VSAFADNPVGRLLQDLIYQGGVDQSHVRWVPYDGVGRACRNGLNFVERGFGIRAGVGCSDRGHTAVSQLEPGTSTGRRSSSVKARAGCTPAASSARCRRRHRTSRARRCRPRIGRGAYVSFDLNYRESLWRAYGGHERAIAVNRGLVPLVDVLIGNEEDFSAALGFTVKGVSNEFAELDLDQFKSMILRVVREFPT
jgi:2-dehydro-3-deoxygluconokinase